MRFRPLFAGKSLRFFGVVFCAVLLSACETELAEDQIRLINAERVGAPDRPFRNWYVGSPFEFEFGIEGGTGSYQVRYLKQAPADSDFADESNTNHIDMEVEIIPGPKSQFRLFGTPYLADGDSIDDISSPTLLYFIEVTDGKQTRLFDFEVELVANSLVTRDSYNLNEGADSNIVRAQQVLGRAIDADNNPELDQFVCRSLREQPLETGKVVDGRQVKFIYEEASFDVPVGSEVEIFYRPISRYSDQQGEFSSANVDDARIGVDVLDEVNSMVFGPKESDCAFRIGIYEDTRIEGNENFEIEFYSSVGAQVLFDNPRSAVEIRNDDPDVVYEPVNVVLNRGENVNIPVSINRGFLSDDSATSTILVSSDNPQTTALRSQYDLVPDSGVLTFLPDQTSADLSVVSKTYELVGEIGTDPVVTIETSVDALLDLDERSRIAVNEWATRVPLDDEVVARGSAQTHARDFAVTDDGLVFVLSSYQTSLANTGSQINAYYRDNTAVSLAGVTTSFEKAGLDVEPIALAVTRGNTQTLLAVIMSVNGLFVDRHFGGTDALVSVYEIRGDQLTLLSTTQLGSEQDDEVVGGKFDRNFQLLLHGSTTGQTLSNGPGSVINAGGKDGFIYALGASGASLQLNWRRFIGDDTDNNMLALEVGRSEVLAMFDRSSILATDYKIEELNRTDGENTDSFDDTTIKAGFTSSVSDILFDDGGRNFFVFGSSESVLPSDELSSNGEDGLVYRYTARGGAATFSRISTPAKDVVKGGAILPERNRLVALGETLGVMEGQAGLGAQDLFFSVLDIEENLDFVATTQFGSPGVDRAIAVRPVSQDKFLVLWSEDFSAGDGSLTYRISAFAPDGRKLSPNPR